MATPDMSCGTPDRYQRIGELTRSLHTALRQLGYDKQIEASLGSLPDARARLSFIERVTGNAAEKVLNTVDAAQVHQHALIGHALRAEELLKKDPAGALARGDLLDFIEVVKSSAEATAGQLSTIMLAQDFHDLTGQTVRKLVDVGAALEEALVQLLMETTPPGQRPSTQSGVLSGPVADPAHRTDVVSCQAQVDDLLESLGF